jgi:hypothetical protein
MMTRKVDVLLGDKWKTRDIPQNKIKYGFVALALTSDSSPTSGEEN